MSRDIVVDKSLVSGEARHTAHVKFHESDGSLYPKEYQYKCDDSIVDAFSKKGAFNHTVDVSGQTKKIRVLKVHENYISTKATKTLPSLFKVGEVKKVQIQGTITSTRDFKIGDEVKICKSSRWWIDDDIHNPKDMVGKITKIIDKDSYIRVIWGNKTQNGYSKEDLDLVTEDSSKVVLGIFRSGDKVKILKDTNGHEYHIGQIVTLETRRERTYDKGKFVWTTGLGENSGVVREEDIELAESQPMVWPKMVNKGSPEYFTKLSLATGVELDQIAASRLVSRDYNESDSSLRARIIALDEKIAIPVDNPSWISDTVVVKDREYGGPQWTTINFEIKPTKEEINMSTTRRTVTIELIDDDKGLDVSDALVAQFENILIETDSDSAIRELLMTADVADKLEEHNVRRLSTVDLEILQRTGNEVKLRAVKLNQLRWNVKA